MPATHAPAVAKPTIGEIYVIDPAFAGKYAGIRFEIVELKQVNAVGHPVDAAGNRIAGARRMRARFAMWLPALGPAELAAAVGSVVTGATTPLLEPLPVGSFVVRSAAATSWNVPDDRIFIVLQDRGDRVKVIEAGGSPDGRYWPGVPRAWLTRIAVDLVPKSGE